ncbi:MAG TPA: cyclic nucleotide-binding domain-containing protein [Armatimonadaceae bacterium]|nr:cyclic nucleotide-binding domain-containing protein [Armatimonadaceae bacterium]
MQKHTEISTAISMTETADQETADLLAAIRQCPTFKNLDKGVQQELSRCLTLRTFAAGEKFWDAHVEAQTLYFLVDGEVQFVTRDRHRHPFHYPEVRRPGAIFGEVGFFARPPRRTATTTAVPKTTVLELHRDQFPAFVAVFPEFWTVLCQQMAERLRRNDELIRTRASGNWSVTPKADRFLSVVSSLPFLIATVSAMAIWWWTKGFGADTSLAHLGVFAGIWAFALSTLILARQLAAGNAAQEDFDTHHADSMAVRQELEAIRRTLSGSVNGGAAGAKQENTGL